MSDTNSFVQCRKCKNKHYFGERLEVYKPKNNMYSLCCPKCNSEVYQFFQEIPFSNDFYKKLNDHLRVSTSDLFYGKIGKLYSIMFKVNKPPYKNMEVTLTKETADELETALLVFLLPQTCYKDESVKCDCQGLCRNSC